MDPLEVKVSEEAESAACSAFSETWIINELDRIVETVSYSYPVNQVVSIRGPPEIICLDSDSCESASDCSGNVSMCSQDGAVEICSGEQSTSSTVAT